MGAEAMGAVVREAVATVAAAAPQAMEVTAVMMVVKGVAAGGGTVVVVAMAGNMAVEMVVVVGKTPNSSQSRAPRLDIRPPVRARTWRLHNRRDGASLSTVGSAGRRPRSQLRAGRSGVA